MRRSIPTILALLLSGVAFAQVPTAAHHPAAAFDPIVETARVSPVDVIAVDHTGFAVSSLDEAIHFWTDALGFTLERRGEMGGDFLRQVTGVADTAVRSAIVRGPDGFAVELLEYAKGHAHGVVPSSAGAIGAAHLALKVVDIDATIRRIEAAGWKVKGSAQPIPGGPRKGTLVAYVSGPDNITIELMQPG